MTKKELIDMGIDEKTAEKVAAATEAEKAKASETLNTELEGLRGQLKEARGKISEFEKMDIESVKASAKEWQDKHEKDTAELKKTISDMEYDYALEKYMSGFKFSSQLAKTAAAAALREKNFKKDDNGKLLGADDFMTELKKNNPAAFADEKSAPVIMTGTGGGKADDAASAARAVMGLK